MKLFELFENNLLINEMAAGDSVGSFKCVFMAGSPGSGKSTIAKKLFSFSGLREANVDQFIEMMQRTDIDHGHVDWDSGDSIAVYHKAKELTNKRMQLFINNRIGLLLDGTGKNYEPIAKTNDDLKRLGYETMMVYVNTNLETALKRNSIRQRKIDSNVVIKFHKAVSDNIGKYQNLFGNNFIIVDNNEDSNQDLSIVWKRLQKFINSPPTSPIAKHWIQDQKHK